MRAWSRGLGNCGRSALLVLAWAAAWGPRAARAHVRQRFYYQGRESLIAWPQGSTIKVSMQDFTGETIGQLSTSTQTSIDFATAQALVGDSLAQWGGPLLGGLAPRFTLDLLSGKPYPTDNRCESKVSATGAGDPDGVNNIVFTSKLGADCGTPLTAYRSAGVIGLTGVRFVPSSGEIGEADIQFDDVDYRFVASGSNNLNVTPKQIVLKDAVTHELGHFFGLDHSAVRESTMLFAIAENLQTTKPDDQLGLLSLYPPEGAAAQLGQAEGSLTDGDGRAVFGGVVFFLNPRTLEVNASEMSDVNGAFHFCALPAGPQIAFATPYRPYGTNIHAYYSGNGDGVTTSDDYGCYNPACGLMTSTLTHSWWGRAPSVGSGGLALNIANVPAGGAAKYVNISARADAATDGLAAAPAGGSALALDEPRVMRLIAENLPVNGTANAGTHLFIFTAPASGNVQLRTAALSIYSRVKLRLRVFDDNSAEVTAANCPVSAGHGRVLSSSDDIANARDPWLDCTGLTAGATYTLQVQGGAIACDAVPGNKADCTVTGIESASTPIPYYIVTIYETARLGDTALGSTELGATSLASARFANLPQCGDKSLDVKDTTQQTTSQPKGGGCCGTLGGAGPGGPSGPASFALALLLSPLAWFALYRAAARRSRLGTN